MAEFDMAIRGLGRGVVNTEALGDIEADSVTTEDLIASGSGATPVLETDGSADTADAAGAWTFAGSVAFSGAVTADGGDVTVEGDSATLIFADFSADAVTIEASTLSFTNIPTADPEVAGQLYSNNGVLTISQGA